MRDRPMSVPRDSADRAASFASHADTRSLPNFSGTAQCSQALPLAFCERFRGCQLSNPPVSEAIVFGVGLGITLIGEQADDLEAVRRTAAYQNRRRHGPFSLFCTAQRRMGALHGRLFPRQGWEVCQISASAAVMAITKWSISGSEKAPLRIICRNREPVFRGSFLFGRIVNSASRWSRLVAGGRPSAPQENA